MERIPTRHKHLDCDDAGNKRGHVEEDTSEREADASAVLLDVDVRERPEATRPRPQAPGVGDVTAAAAGALLAPFYGSNWLSHAPRSRAVLG